MDDPAPSEGTHIELADVVVDGHLIMRVRGTVSFPAARRAAEIEQNILAAARDASIPADAVTIKVEGERTLLFAGDRLLLDMLDADAALEDLSRQLLAEIREERIEEVIAEYRLDRSPKVLLRHSAYALSTVTAAVGLIVLFWWGFRRLAELLDRRLQQQIKQLEEKSARLIRERNLTGLLRLLTKLAFLGLVALTLYRKTWSVPTFAFR